MSDEVEFVDSVPGEVPPNSRIHRQRVREFAEQVKRNPGRWAVYPYPTTELGARAAASRISRGKVVGFGDGFEAVCQRGTVYVRYMGAAL